MCGPLGLDLAHPKVFNKPLEGRMSSPPGMTCWLYCNSVLRSPSTLDLNKTISCWGRSHTVQIWTSPVKSDPCHDCWQVWWKAEPGQRGGQVRESASFANLDPLSEIRSMSEHVTGLIGGSTWTPRRPNRRNQRCTPTGSPLSRSGSLIDHSGYIRLMNKVGWRGGPGQHGGQVGEVLADVGQAL